MVKWEDLKEYEYLTDARFVEHTLMPRIKELIGTGKRVLDVGARGCVWACYYAQGTGNRVVGVDIGEMGAAEAIVRDFGGGQVEFKPKVDVTLELPFPEKSFDVAILSATLEHLWVPGDHFAVENMIKVAREKVIISTPLYKDCPWEPDRGRGCADHINLFTEERFRDFLGRFGYPFTVEIFVPGYSSLLGVLDVSISNAGV